MESFFIYDFLEQYRNNSTNCQEQALLYADRISKSQLNAFISFDGEDVLNRAKNITQNHSNLPLYGVPIAVKDNFCVQGYRATNGSKMLENYYPPFESTVTERLWQNGAFLVGKTNMDEFAMGSSGTSSYFGSTLSPWKINNENLNPGGSSSGSAASVAAGLALLSVGSDTGGSVRQPAAFCGLVGFKPTYGRVSRWGIIAYASSFDQVAFFTRSVYDAALLTHLTAGEDGKDSTLINEPAPPFHLNLDKNIRGLKIGLIKELEADKHQVNSEINQHQDMLIQMLKDEGAEIVEVSIPHIKYCINIYNAVSRSEAASNFARYDGVKFGYRAKEFGKLDDMIALSRAEGFGTEVKNRILVGTSILLKEYRHIYDNLIQMRYLIKDEFNEAFKRVDALLTPVSPILPPPLSYKMSQLEEYMCDIFTLFANVVGIPAISFPVGLSKDQRPIGLQLMSNSFKEQTLLNITYNIEQNFKFVDRYRCLLENLIF